MNSDAAVFRKSRMPLYLQVAKLMRQQIEREAWRYGEQIPTLDELERTYQVSRITLRAALDQLEELGIVRRTRGLGTFVAKDLSRERWFKLPTTLDELVEAVAELKIRLLPVADESAAPLTPAFPCGEPAPAYRRLLRVHYHEDEPYCLISLHIDRQIFDAAPEAFSSKPIVPQLVRLPGVRIAQARQVMRITVADETTARHLDIGVGDPVAHVCRAIVDERGRIVYYAEIQYPAQMFQIEMDLLRSPAPRRPRERPPQPAAKRSAATARGARARARA